MFNISVSYFVEFLKDNFVEEECISYGNNTIKKALYIRIPLSLNYKNKIKRSYAHFILANYCYFAAETDEYHNDPKYKLISRHGSCWRYEIEKFINKIYFRMAREINSNIAPYKMDSGCFLTMAEVKKVIIEYKSENAELVSIKYRKSPQKGITFIGEKQISILENE